MQLLETGAHAMRGLRAVVETGAHAMRGLHAVVGDWSPCDERLTCSC